MRPERSGQPASAASGVKADRRTRAAELREGAQRAEHRSRFLVYGAAALAVVVVVVALFAVYRATGGGGAGQAGGTAAKPTYEVGQPGPGTVAPNFDLASSAGGTLDLASLWGKTVLLYFQEGLTCQPCWDQIRDLEQDTAKVKAAGIDQIVSIPPTRPT